MQYLGTCTPTRLTIIMLVFLGMCKVLALDLDWMAVWRIKSWQLAIASRIADRYLFWCTPPRGA